MTKTEINLLAGCSNWYQSTDVLARRLGKRNWRRGGKHYKFSGIDSKTYDVHLVSVTAVDGGCCVDRRIIPMDMAIDCISGNF